MFFFFDFGLRSFIVPCNRFLHLSTGDSKVVSGDYVDGLIPNTSQYITYEGSLTTPGCHEVVTWIVLNKPVYVTPTQVRHLYSSCSTLIRFIISLTKSWGVYYVKSALYIPPCPHINTTRHLDIPTAVHLTQCHSDVCMPPHISTPHHPQAAYLFLIYPPTASESC